MRINNGLVVGVRVWLFEWLPFAFLMTCYLVICLHFVFMLFNHQTYLLVDYNFYGEFKLEFALMLLSFPLVFAHTINFFKKVGSESYE